METENTIVNPDTHAADGGTEGDTEMHDAEVSTESPDDHFEEKKEDGAGGLKSSVNSLDFSDEGTAEDEGDGNRVSLVGDAGRRAALVDPSTKSQQQLTQDLTGFKFHTRSLVDLTPQGVLRPDPGESVGPLILEGSGEEVTIEYLNSSYRAHIWDVLNSKERRPVVGTYARQLDKAHKLFETLGDNAILKRLKLPEPLKEFKPGNYDVVGEFDSTKTGAHLLASSIKVPLWFVLNFMQTGLTSNQCYQPVGSNHRFLHHDKIKDESLGDNLMDHIKCVSSDTSLQLGIALPMHFFGYDCKHAYFQPPNGERLDSLYSASYEIDGSEQSSFLAVTHHYATMSSGVSFNRLLAFFNLYRDETTRPSIDDWVHLTRELFDTDDYLNLNDIKGFKAWLSDKRIVYQVPDHCKSLISALRDFGFFLRFLTEPRWAGFEGQHRWAAAYWILMGVTSLEMQAILPVENADELPPDEEIGKWLLFQPTGMRFCDTENMQSDFVTNIKAFKEWGDVITKGVSNSKSVTERDLYVRMHEAVRKLSNDFQDLEFTNFVCINESTVSEVIDTHKGPSNIVRYIIPEYYDCIVKTFVAIMEDKNFSGVYGKIFKSQPTRKSWQQNKALFGKTMTLKQKKLIDLSTGGNNMAISASCATILSLYKYLCMREEGLTALGLFLNCSKLDEGTNFFPSDIHYEWRWIKQFILVPVLEAVEFLKTKAKEEIQYDGKFNGKNQAFYLPLYYAFVHVNMSELLRTVVRYGLNPKVGKKKNYHLDTYQGHDGIPAFPAVASLERRKGTFEVIAANFPDYIKQAYSKHTERSGLYLLHDVYDHIDDPKHSYLKLIENKEVTSLEDTFPLELHFSYYFTEVCTDDISVNPVSGNSSFLRHCLNGNNTDANKKKMICNLGLSQEEVDSLGLGLPLKKAVYRVYKFDLAGLASTPTTRSLSTPTSSVKRSAESNPTSETPSKRSSSRVTSAAKSNTAEAGVIVQSKEAAVSEEDNTEHKAMDRLLKEMTDKFKNNSIQAETAGYMVRLMSPHFSNNAFNKKTVHKVMKEKKKVYKRTGESIEEEFYLQVVKFLYPDCDAGMKWDAILEETKNLGKKKE